MTDEYMLDIISARHERAERKLWAIIVAQSAAIVLLALWRRKQ
jgi:hypothetical protein